MNKGGNMIKIPHEGEIHLCHKFPRITKCHMRLMDRLSGQQWDEKATKEQLACAIELKQWRGWLN